MVDLTDREINDGFTHNKQTNVPRTVRVLYAMPTGLDVQSRHYYRLPVLNIEGVRRAVTLNSACTVCHRGNTDSIHMIAAAAGFRFEPRG